MAGARLQRGLHRMRHRGGALLALDRRGALGFFSCHEFNFHSGDESFARNSGSAAARLVCDGEAFFRNSASAAARLVSDADVEASTSRPVGQAEEARNTTSIFWGLPNLSSIHDFSLPTPIDAMADHGIPERASPTKRASSSRRTRFRRTR